jgi:hypothetical protein
MDMEMSAAEVGAVPVEVDAFIVAREVASIEATFPSSDAADSPADAFVSLSAVESGLIGAMTFAENSDEDAF